MTTPFDSQAWPQDPTGPSSAPQGYSTPSQPSTTPNEPPITSAQISGQRARFYELLIRQLLAAIFGFFSPAGGSALSQFSSWAATIPFVGQPLSNAINFVLNFLDPTKLLFSQTRLENPPQDGWPKLLPSGWGEILASPIELLVQNLSRIITPGVSTGGNLISQAFTIPTTILSFIEGILLPRSRVAELDATTGLVPDSQKPQAVQDIVDHASNAFAGNPIGELVNFGVSSFFSVIGGLLGTGSHAQSVNVVQNAQLDALTAGGSGVFSTFDGASSNDLGASFVQIYFDGGSGVCGLDGDGNAVWKAAGGSVRGCHNRHVTAVTTDTQKVSLVIKYDLKSQNITDPQVALHGRCKLDMTESVDLWILPDTCEIGYVVAGSYTRLGSAVGIDQSSGVWELKLGTTLDDREFIAYRDGVEILRRTDTLDASALGVNNRSLAFTMRASLQFAFIFIQKGCATIESMSGSDRTASS